MSVITTQVVKHNCNVTRYLIFQVAIIVGCSLVLTGVMAVISYLFISWIIELFKANVTLFCYLVFSFRLIGKPCPRAAVEMFYTTALPLLLCILQTFPRSPYPDTFLKGQGHLHS